MWSALALLLSLTPAPPPPSPSRADLFTRAVKHDLHLSADGLRFGYLQPDSHGVDQLVVGTVNDPKAARPVTSGPDAVQEWRFAFSGEHTLFTRAVESGAVHLFVIPTEGGSTFDVTPDAVGETFLVGHGRQWPTHVALEYQPKGKQRGVWLLDFVTKERHRMCAGGFDRYVFDGNMWPMGASDDARIARMQPDGQWAILERTDPLTAKVSGVICGDYGGSVLFYVSTHGSDRSRLLAIDLENGARTVLAEHPRADLLPFGFQVDARTHLPVAVAARFGETERVLVDRKALARLFEVDHAVTPPIGEEWELIGLDVEGELAFVDQDVSGKRWLFSADRGGPLAYYVYDRETLELFPLGSALPGSAESPAVQMQSFPVPARDGLELPCRLYRPAHHGDGPLPTVLYVHGGPWSLAARDGWETRRHLDLLVARGYAVLEVEFRGAVGYGRAWTDLGNGEWGGRMIDDIVDAAHAAVETGVAREDALGILGMSYGGYAVLRAMTREPKLFTCGIALGAISDLQALQEARQGDPAWRALWNARVGDPAKEKEAARLRAQSPLGSAAELEAPLLMAHGALDLIVPKSQSDQFARAASQAGAPLTYLVFQTEPHELRRPRSWRAFWAVGEAFLHAHLGGAAEPPGKDLDLRDMVVAVGAEHIPVLVEAEKH